MKIKLTEEKLNDIILHAYNKVLKENADGILFPDEFSDKELGELKKIEQYKERAKKAAERRRRNKEEDELKGIRKKSKKEIEADRRYEEAGFKQTSIFDYPN